MVAIKSGSLFRLTLGHYGANMNFLQLCQRLRQETGIGESGPTSVTGQTGDMQRLVDWVNESWVRLQSSRKDWDWLWANASVSLLAGGNTVALPTSVDQIVEITHDGSPLKQMTYAEFREGFRTIGPGTPTAFAVRPDNKVVLNAITPTTLTLAIEYYAKPAYLSLNTDEPGLPERFHMLIVWMALNEYALFDEAPELSTKARTNTEQIYAELELDQTPAVSLPGALA